MNKKLFGTALLGLLLSAATGTFVSCKDYDDDIENLQNQINDLKSVKTSVDGLKSDLAGVQSTCQANIASAIADLKNGDVKKALADAADAAAKASAASAEAASATSAAVGAQATADAATTAAAAAQTAADAANTLAQAAKDAAAAAQAAADKAQSTADGISFEEKDAKALEKIAKLAEKIAGVEGALLEAADVEKMIADAQLAGSAVDADTLAKIKAALAQLEDATASIIGKRLTSLVYAPTTYINGIEAINFVNLVYRDWKDDAKKWYADKASEWAVDETGWDYTYKYGKIADFGTTATYLVSPAGVEMSGIESLSYRLNDATNTRAASSKDVTLTISNPKIEGGKLTIDLAKTIAEGKGNLPGVLLTMDILKELSISKGGSVTVKVKDILASLKGKATDVKYTDKNAAADAVAATNEELVKEILSSIFKNKGINSEISAANANLEVELTEGEIDVVIEGLKAQNKEDLIIAALEAKLANSVLDTDEKKEGKEVSVFSDWARIQESWEYPLIHNVAFKDHKSNGAHFWAFSDIYKAEGEDALKTVFNSDDANKYIGVKALYSDDLDLTDVVKVCTKDINTRLFGREINKEDLVKYGLEFNFAVMPYIVENEKDTKDVTDQAKFAILKGSKLTPCSENQKVHNANAIDHTPVIQVVLRDTNAKEGEGIIDVRYFKVKWVAELANTEISDVTFSKIFAYTCDNYADAWIYENEMNDFYAEFGENGISKSQFRAAYPNLSLGKTEGQIFRIPEGEELSEEFIEKFMASYDPDDYNGTNHNNMYGNCIGKVEWKDDNDVGTQTQNLALSYYADYVNPYLSNGKQVFDKEGNTKFELAPEDNFTVNGFFWFESADGAQHVYVPVTLVVKKNSYYVKYDPIMWKYTTLSPEDHDKYRTANPSLSKNPELGTGHAWKTTQIQASITKGYAYELVDGGKTVSRTPNSTNKLVKVQYNGETVQGQNIAGYAAWKKLPVESLYDDAYTNVVFDADRLNEINKDDEGAGLHHKYNNVPFAWFTSLDGKELYYGIEETDLNGKPQGKLATSDDPADFLGSMGAKIDDAADLIYLVDNGKDKWGSDYPTEAALLLVGHQAPIKVMAMCGYTDNEDNWSGCGNSMEIADNFLFNFLEPLNFNSIVVSESLKDIVNGVKDKRGDSKTIDFSALKLTENYGDKKDITLYGASDDDNKARKAWYGVGTPKVLADMIRTNMTKDGSGRTEKCETLLSDIQKADGSQRYVINFDNKVKVVTPGQGEGTHREDAYKKDSKERFEAVELATLKTKTATELQTYKTTGVKVGDITYYLVLKADGTIDTKDKVDEEGKTVYSNEQKTVDLKYTTTVVKGEDGKAIELGVTSAAGVTPKTYKQIRSWAGTSGTNALVYDANVWLLNTKELYAETQAKGYKPNEQPCWKKSDGKYYTLPSGGEEIPEFTKEDGTKVSPLVYTDAITVRYYTKNATEAAVKGTVDETKVAYESNGSWYTKKGGKGELVKDLRDLYKYTDGAYYTQAGGKGEKITAFFMIAVQEDEFGNPVKDENLDDVIIPVENEKFTESKVQDPGKAVYVPEKVSLWQYDVKNSKEEWVQSNDGKGTVEFINMNDNAIAESFKVEIPVVVDTKWKKQLTGVITITVEPNFK